MRIFVDDIHEGFATLLLGEDESVRVRLPLAWLPEGVKEGSVLQATFSEDPAGAKEDRQQIDDLIKSLRGDQG